MVCELKKSGNKRPKKAKRIKYGVKSFNSQNRKDKKGKSRDF
jgi:hypothetical protein